MILSCIFPCLAVYFLRKAAREKYDIDVNALHSFQTVKIIFVLLNRETSLGMPLVLAVVHFVFNAKLELKSPNRKGVQYLMTQRVVMTMPKRSTRLGNTFKILIRRIKR